MEQKLPELELIRTDCNEFRIFGEIFFQGLRCVDTIELPWRENKPFLSCIPEGEYKFRVITHPKFKMCIELLDVPGREGIFIHSANYARQLKGCIAPGFRAGERVESSRECLNELTQMVDTGTILIRSNT